VDCRVVCVSGALGAGAPEAAALVAERLGFRVVDEEILARAAEEAGVEPHVVAEVEERRTFVRRLLHGLGESADGSSLAFGGLPALLHDTPTSDDLRGLIRAAIEEAGSEGSVVLVAHAASVALAGRDDVLRVLVTASPEVRIRRYAEQHGVDEDAAGKEISFSDGARADYLKRFYGIEREVPTLYDLVVNTDRSTPSAAASLILLAAGADDD
jgi:cytidylate kinase